jgi:hypothetical protein
MPKLSAQPGTVIVTSVGTFKVPDDGIVEVSEKRAYALIEAGFELVEGEAPAPATEPTPATEEKPDDVVERTSIAGKKTKRVVYSRTEEEEV